MAFWWLALAALQFGGNERFIRSCCRQCSIRSCWVSLNRRLLWWSNKWFHTLVVENFARISAGRKICGKVCCFGVINSSCLCFIPTQNDSKDFQIPNRFHSYTNRLGTDAYVFSLLMCFESSNHSFTLLSVKNHIVTVVKSWRIQQTFIFTELWVKTIAIWPNAIIKFH